MDEILRASMPPDVELLELIEGAYLRSLIDGETQALAFAWLRVNDPSVQ